MKIKNKILVPVLSVTIVGFIIFGIFGYLSTKDLIDNQINIQVENNLLSLVRSLEGNSDSQESLNNLKLQKGVEAYILDKEGMTIAHIDTDKVGKSVMGFDFGKKILSMKSGELEYNFEYNGESSQKHSYFEEVGNYIAVMTADIETLYEPLDNFTRNLFIIGIILAVITFLIITFTTNKITKPLSILTEKIKEFGDGKISVKFNIDTTDEIGVMSSALNNMASALKDTLLSVKEMAKNLDTTSKNLKKISEENSDNGERIFDESSDILKESEIASANSQEINSSVEEVASSSQTLSTSAQNMASNSDILNNKITVSRKSLSELLSKVEQILKANSDSIKVTEELEKNANNIGEIVDTINSITEQTSLLALNAAIEAARAGEAGKGFAVVADEIRKLADDSSDATENIAKKLKELKDGAIKGNEYTQKGKIELEETMISSKEMQENFNELVDNVKNIIEDIENVSSISEEQTASTEEISGAIDNIAKTIETLNDKIKVINSTVDTQNKENKKLKSNSYSISQISDTLEEKLEYFRM